MRWAKPIALVVGAVAFLSVAWALWFALQSNEQLVSLVFSGRSTSRHVRGDRTNLPAVPNDGRSVPADLRERTAVEETPVVERPDERRSADGGWDTPRMQQEQRSRGMKRAEPVGVPIKTERPSGADTAEPEQLTGAKRRQFGQHLQNARRALSRRQFDAAKEHLAAARPLARTSELEAMVERLDTLHQYVHAFWMAVEDGMVDLENTELVVGGNRTFVVELTPQQIVLRIEGRNRPFSRDKLPARLAIAIADRWFDQNASSTKVFKGAFMAVTPGYSEQEVRQLWRQAQREGTELGDLIQVLDDRDWTP